ncbi:RDD family protein [Plantactinospora sp. B24E8]|uniref:RDD family protein n=1 Tax=Plantactinospora sp. B24E8 TaxID=3153567 RepID=UPI00325CEA64
MTVQPGWYPDPAEPTTQRYWDGDGWIGAPLPVDAEPPAGPPPAEPEPAPVSGPSGATDTGPTSPAAPSPPAGPFGAPPAGPFGAPPGTPPYGPPPGWNPHAGPPPGWNPYAGPPPGWHPSWTPPPRPHGMALAPLSARLVARLIDISIVFLLNVVVNGWFVWRFVQEIEPLSQELSRRWLNGEASTANLPQASPQADGLQVVILLIAVALWFAYEVPSVANSGQTLGKRLMGIKVVPVTETEQLGFGRSFRRWNMLGLPVFLWSCCGIGFLIQLLDCGLAVFDRPLRQTLHDKRAMTVVVQLPRRTVPPHAPGSPAGPTGSPTDRPGGTES